MSNRIDNKNTLPNLLIIGAMKAGTSSLHQYLSVHPEIFMSKTKELNFFNKSLNWSKGIDWYKSQFDSSFKYNGESSPNYSKWDDTPDRIFSVLPNAKIIYLLRDPVDRFVSQCNHVQVDPNRVVDDLKQGKASEIFTNGLYYKWYSMYNKLFPKEHMLLLKSEDLRHSKQKVLLKIFDFLHLQHHSYDFDAEQLSTERHITKNKLIASQNIQKLNSNRLYLLIKRFIKPLKPILKPIQSKLFYKKRVIKKLSKDNKNFLMKKYSEDLRKLQEETGISFGYGY